MSNKLTEELRNFVHCLNDEQSRFRAHARMDFCEAADMGRASADFYATGMADFCEGGAQDFSRGGRTHGAILRADFSYGTAILTAPKPLLDKALSKGGGG